MSKTHRLIVAATALSGDYHTARIVEFVRDRWEVVALAHCHAPTGTLINVASYNFGTVPSDSVLADLSAAWMAR